MWAQGLGLQIVLSSWRWEVYNVTHFIKTFRDISQDTWCDVEGNLAQGWPALLWYIPCPVCLHGLKPNVNSGTTAKIWQYPISQSNPIIQATVSNRLLCKITGHQLINRGQASQDNQYATHYTIRAAHYTSRLLSINSLSRDNAGPFPRQSLFTSWYGVGPSLWGQPHRAFLTYRLWFWHSQPAQRPLQHH